IRTKHLCGAVEAERRETSPRALERAGKVFHRSDVDEGRLPRQLAPRALRALGDHHRHHAMPAARPHQHREALPNPAAYDECAIARGRAREGDHPPGGVDELDVDPREIVGGNHEDVEAAPRLDAEREGGLGPRIDGQGDAPHVVPAAAQALATLADLSLEAGPDPELA